MAIRVVRFQIGQIRHHNHTRIHGKILNIVMPRGRYIRVLSPRPCPSSLRPETLQTEARTPSRPLPPSPPERKVAWLREFLDKWHQAQALRWFAGCHSTDRAAYWRQQHLMCAPTDCGREGGEGAKSRTAWPVSSSNTAVWTVRGPPHRKRHNKKACTKRAAELMYERLYSRWHERPDAGFCPICTHCFFSSHSPPRSHSHTKVPNGVC